MILWFCSTSTKIARGDDTKNIYTESAFIREVYVKSAITKAAYILSAYIETSWAKAGNVMS